MILKKLLLALFIITWSASCVVAQFAAQQTYCAGSCVGGTANAIILNVPNIVSASDLVGVPIRFKVALANTGPTTVSVPPTGTAPLLKFTSTGLSPLIGGELPIGPPAPVAEVVYDGTEYVIMGVQPPTPLVAPLNYYVNSGTGLDSNNGLTIATAFATIQRGVAAAQSINMNGFTVTINVANGSYQPITLGPLNGSGTVFLTGNNTTPATTTISSAAGPAILVNNSGYVVSGFQLSSAANNGGIVGACVYVTGAAALEVANLNFSSCFFSDLLAQFGGNISVLGAVEGLPSDFITILGPTNFFAYALNGGSIAIGQPILNVSATFTVAAFVATVDGNISGTFLTQNLTGTVSGPSFSAILNGVVNTGTANPRYFPGTSCTVASCTSTGGQYL